MTTGGGGDGADLIHNVFHAYQQDPSLTHRALVVLGPFMPAKKRRKLMRKGAGIPFIEIIEFDNRMEELIAGAKAVVGMGGYNTFCEILSFDKPALIVPRVAPREEQLIRAQRAAELGLIDMLLPEEADDPPRFAAALKALPDRAPPSQSSPNLQAARARQHLADRRDWLDQRTAQHLSVVEGKHLICKTDARSSSSSKAIRVCRKPSSHRNCWGSNRPAST